MDLACFGLRNGHGRRNCAPILRHRSTATRAKEGLLKSLDQVVEAHRETAVTIKTPNGQTTQELFGNLRWFRQRPDFPLQEVWREWLEGQSAKPTELTRAFSTGIHSFK